MRCEEGRAGQGIGECERRISNERREEHRGGEGSGAERKECEFSVW